jgi:hypothetical protein
MCNLFSVILCNIGQIGYCSVAGGGGRLLPFSSGSFVSPSSSLYECDWIPHFKRGAHIFCARDEGAEDPA